MKFKRRKRDLKKVQSKGRSLSEEDRIYIVETLTRLRAGFDTDEEKEIFVSNVLEEVSGREEEFAYNNLGSQCLEGLLNCATSTSQVAQVSRAVIKKLRGLIGDSYGSHVVETLSRVLARSVADKRLLTDEEQIESELAEHCDKVVCFALNNAEDFIADTFGSHVMRTALESATGVKAGPTGNINKRVQDNKDSTQPEGFVSPKIQTCVLSLSRQIATNPDLIDVTSTESSSTVVQTLILALGKVANEACQDLCKVLLSRLLASIEEDPMRVFDDVCATRLLESILQVGNKEVLAPVWSSIISNNAITIAKHPVGKFTLQVLMEHCEDREKFEELTEELCGRLKSLIKIGHTGVIIACAKACRRLGAKQGLFLSSMMDALKCREPPERQVTVVPLVCGLVKHKQYDKQSTKFECTTHGSVILQEMLHFNKPVKLVDSLLHLPDEQLLFLSTDRRGSHVLDAFFTAKYVGEKSRYKLLDKIKGYMSQMAVTAPGSRCLDTMWDKGTIKHRSVIAASLAADSETVHNDKIGKFLYAKCAVKLFNKKPDDWREYQNKQLKTKGMFSSILEGPPKKKPRSQPSFMIDKKGAVSSKS